MRALGKFLWEAGRAEAGAVAVLPLIEGDATLTDAERRFIDRRMLPEERAHARVTRDWARRWAPPPRYPGDAFGALLAMHVLLAPATTEPSRFVWTLAITHWNEANTVRAYRRFIPTFDRVSPDLGRDFRQILAEEEGHVAWGRGVIARLEREAGPTFRRLRVAARLVRHVYATVAYSTEGRLLKAIERELAG